MGKLLSIEEIKPGMVLAKPILNKYNQILVPAGTAIEEKHKNIFKTWNVYKIHIIDGSESEIKAITPEILELAKGKVMLKFLWKPKHEYEQDILDMAILNQAENLIKGIN